LVGGIVTARDEMEINGFIKALAKLQASIGLVETKRDNDKAPGLMSQFADVMKPVSGMSPAESTMLGMSFGGSKVVSLAPGRDVKAITDNRPGPNTLQFLATQHKRVDDSLGLSNAVADDSSKLTSASTRLELDMLKRWIDKRQHWKKPMLHWVYRYFMAAEIAAGRLDPPREGNFEAVYWVPCRDLSIDVGRLASAAVNLMREGVMSRRQYTLATEGRTPEEIAAENAELFAHYAELEQLHGLAPGSLRQSALGATDVAAPVPDNSEQNNIEK
jgi:capsid protein